MEERYAINRMPDGMIIQEVVKNEHLQDEKKPIPEITDKVKDAIIATLLIMHENLVRKKAYVGLRQEAIDTFPESQKPLFIWNKSKESWTVSLPEPEGKILTPEKRIIGS